MDDVDDPGSLLEGDNDEYNADELLRAFRIIWRNERYAPELLPEKLAVVDALLDTVNGKEQEIKGMRSTDHDSHFQVHLQKMENNRIRFMVANYLRCRLEKIEAFAVHLADLHEAEQRIRMSDPERKFLEGLLRKMESHLRSSIGTFLPANVPVVGDGSDWKKYPMRPKLNVFVVIKPRETLERVMLPDLAEPLDLEKGSQYLLKYSNVREFIFTGDEDLRKAKAELM